MDIHLFTFHRREGTMSDTKRRALDVLYSIRDDPYRTKLQKARAIVSIDWLRNGASVADPFLSQLWPDGLPWEGGANDNP